VTVQRLIELRGISTVLITVDPEQSAQANPPRGLHPQPFVAGSSLGKPNDPALQKRILSDALTLVRDAKEPGQIVSRDYA
jgi:hypothetical protein